jgi:probable rRNA maturation factor
MVKVEIADQQSFVSVDAKQIARVARSILADHGPKRSRVSVAIVDDATIHALNRRYLQHDYPTDVLSFLLEEKRGYLEGEVVVSGETALAQAGQYGWDASSELLLYVVHGVLHLVGFEDSSDETRQDMREAEAHYLAQLGLHVPDQDEEAGDDLDE